MVDSWNAAPERRNGDAARRAAGGWYRARSLVSDDLAGMRALVLSPSQFWGVNGFAADVIAGVGARREWQDDMHISAYRPRAERTAFADEPVATTEGTSWQAMRAAVHRVRHGQASAVPPADAPRARAGHEVVNNHDKGTAGTRRDADKVRACRVEMLVRRGLLDVEHQRAADEIECVMMAFARGLGLKASSLERSGGASRKPADPMSRMQAREYALWRNRYRPWAALMQAMPVMRRPERARGAGGEPERLQAFAGVLPLVIDVVCDNAALSECDVRYGLRKGTASDLLLVALHRYALISGSVSGPVWVENVAKRISGVI